MNFIDFFLSHFYSQFKFDFEFRLKGMHFGIVSTANYISAMHHCEYATVKFIYI